MATLREATRALAPAQRRRMVKLPPSGDGTAFVGPPEHAPPPPSGMGRPPAYLVPPVTDHTQVVSPALKCPLPLVDAQPDGLRQFYRVRLPQNRVITPNS